MMIDKQKGEATTDRANGVASGRPWRGGMTSTLTAASYSVWSPVPGGMSQAGPGNRSGIQWGVTAEQGHVISHLLYPLAVSQAPKSCLTLYLFTCPGRTMTKRAMLKGRSSYSRILGLQGKSKDQDLGVGEIKSIWTESSIIFFLKWYFQLNKVEFKHWLLHLLSEQ